MLLPPTTLIRQYDTHRLIPSKYLSGRASVLSRIAADDAHLQDLFDLDNATNDRLAGENDLLPGIGVKELVFGVPNFSIINAAFCHAHPLGSRFNGPDRGAWYAGFDIETAQAEVAWHKSLEYAEIDFFHDTITYEDVLADFAADFHDIRHETSFTPYLAPNSYVESQSLAEQILQQGGLGLVYPSVRRPPAPCIACFRPALVGNVRRDRRWRFTWSGLSSPNISMES